MTHTSILNLILQQASQVHHSGGAALTVFDLDSTLFNVTGRNRRIIREFASLPRVQQNYPEQANILNRAQFQETDWGIREALVREGLSATPEFFFEIREYWSQHFFSNHFLHEDRPYEGAVDYVHALRDAGCQIIYLTGRDEPRMGPGTRESLQHWKFPSDNDGCQLILKPQQSLDDAEFKANVFLELMGPANVAKAAGADKITTEKTKYDLVWFFENEPVNIHFVAKHIPSVQIIYFDSTHSRRAEPPLHLPTIRSYRR